MINVVNSGLKPDLRFGGRGRGVVGAGRTSQRGGEDNRECRAPEKNTGLYFALHKPISCDGSIPPIRLGCFGPAARLCQLLFVAFEGFPVAYREFSGN